MCFSVLLTAPLSGRFHDVDEDGLLKVSAFFSAFETVACERVFEAFILSSGSGGGAPGICFPPQLLSPSGSVSPILISKSSGVRPEMYHSVVLFFSFTQVQLSILGRMNGF